MSGSAPKNDWRLFLRPGDHVSIREGSGRRSGMIRRIELLPGGFARLTWGPWRESVVPLADIGPRAFGSMSRLQREALALVGPDWAPAPAGVRGTTLLSLERRGLIEKRATRALMGLLLAGHAPYNGGGYQWRAVPGAASAPGRVARGRAEASRGATGPGAGPGSRRGPARSASMAG